MRKAVIFSLCLLCLGAAINRNAFKDDISKRCVVQGVGVDVSDDGSYTVTLETINTENYSTSDSSAKPVMNIFTFKGDTVAGAIKNAYYVTGKTPVMSQNRVIIIGRALAEKGIINALDYFIRDAENYPSVLVALADTSAQEFFSSAKSETSVTSREVENIILTADDNVAVSSVTLCELVNRYKSAGESFYMPILSVSEDGEKKKAVSSGTAVFKAGRLICNLNKSETAMLNFLCGNVKKGNVDFEIDGVRIALSVIGSKTEKNVDFKDGIPYFNMNIKIRADLTEAQTGDIFKEDVDKIKSESEKKIEEDISLLIEKLYFGKETDAVGLSRLVYIKYPDYYRQNEKNLSEIMAQSHYSAKADVSIRRIGQDYSK